MAAGPPPDGVCAECNGAGYYTLAVPVGHLDFGKLIPCACLIRAREQRVQQQQAQQRQAVLAELAYALGRLAEAQFDTFDCNRPLVELVWGGETFGVDVQRQALHQAILDARLYAEDPCGWLYLCGPCGAGKTQPAICPPRE